MEKDLSDKVGLASLDGNALISLELASSSGVYNNAAALLADDNQFVGTDVVRFGSSISKILSRRTFEGVSVLAQMEWALAAFDEYYTYEEVEGAIRVVKSLVPREASREAIAVAAAAKERKHCKTRDSGCRKPFANNERAFNVALW